MESESWRLSMASVVMTPVSNLLSEATEDDDHLATDSKWYI